MSDNELIRALRREYEYGPSGTPCLAEASDRLEALIAENEHLREATKMIPRWHQGTEFPPMEKQDDPEGDDWWESDQVVAVTSDGKLAVAQAWKINAKTGWSDVHSGKTIEVSLWMSSVSKEATP